MPFMMLLSKARATITIKIVNNNSISARNIAAY